MTVEEARSIADNPGTHSRDELAQAVVVLAREVDRREAHELEAARLRAHAEMVRQRSLVNG